MLKIIRRRYPALRTHETAVSALPVGDASVGQDQVAIVQSTRSIGKPVTVWVFDKSTGQPRARLAVPPTISIEGWTDDGALDLFIDNRRLTAWDPQTGRLRRALEIPPPHPQSREWAATTVALPDP